MRFPFAGALLGLLLSQASYSVVAAQLAPDVLAPARQSLLRHDYAAASAHYQRAFQQLGPGKAKARDYYQAARAAARNHESKRAVAWLTQAVTVGYFSAAQLQAEQDFAFLTSQPAWPQLLTLARTKQEQQEAPFDPALVALVKKIYYRDQYYRLVAEVAEQQFGSDAPQIGEAMRQQERVDRVLIRQVDSLLARHGYPGRSLVGAYQQEAVFFVIQHSPADKYLPVLTVAADKGELSWSALALFIDRLKVGRGEPQVYGSQLGAAVNGHYTLDPIEDESQVNVRRAKIGLEPLEEYVQHWGIAYQVPTATHNPNPPSLYTTAGASAATESPVELLGGYEALQAQVRYPAAAQAKRVQGEVTLQLLVDKAGVPQDVVVVQGLGYGCDEEALRVMRAARFQNAAGQEHEIRMRLAFPYLPAPAK